MSIKNGEVKIKQFKEQKPEKHKFLTKFDVFTWTLPEILKTVRDFSVEITEIIANRSIPELKKESIQTKGILLVKYAYHAKKIESIPSQIEPKIVRIAKNLTQEEERLNLFNRSIDYYADCEKVPKKK